MLLHPFDSEFDISQARGLVHLRHALVQDESYEWNVPPASADEFAWRHALRLERGDSRAVIAFDLDRQRAALAGSEQAVALSPRLANGLKTFFDDVLSN